MIELLFSLMPFVLLGTIFLILGLKSKKKYESKCKNAVKATVTNVKVEEERNTDGYLKKYKYILELTYSYNGTQIINNYVSHYEYEIGSIIDLDIKNGFINAILTKPPKDVRDNFKSLDLRLYQILLGISIFLFGFGAMGVCVNSVDILGEKYRFIECLVLVGILLSVSVFFNKKREGYDAKYKLIKSGGYSAIMGKVVDMKKTVRYEDHRRYEHYYPIVEYQEGYDVKRKVIYNDYGSNNIMYKDMLIYKDRSTGDVLSEKDVEFLKLKSNILKGIIIFNLIFMVICVISYL